MDKAVQLYDVTKMRLRVIGKQMKTGQYWSTNLMAMKDTVKQCLYVKVLPFSGVSTRLLFKERSYTSSCLGTLRTRTLYNGDITCLACHEAEDIHQHFLMDCPATE